jgi:hypothetical protein
LLISGTSTPFNLLNAGILDPVDRCSAAVKDPKRWFAPHLARQSKRFLYAFQAYSRRTLVIPTPRSRRRFAPTTIS